MPSGYQSTTNGDCVHKLSQGCAQGAVTHGTVANVRNNLRHAKSALLRSTMCDAPDDAWWSHRPDGTRAEIYLKREDLNHTGAHKINNSLGQVTSCWRHDRAFAAVATWVVTINMSLQCY
jgi:threonine dehydratase